jgi:hypothetical protein
MPQVQSAKMGQEQSNAHGYTSYQRRVLISDGQHVREIVNVQREGTFVNQTPDNLVRMMTATTETAEKQFDLSLRAAAGLAERGQNRLESQESKGTDDDGRFLACEDCGEVRVLVRNI